MKLLQLTFYTVLLTILLTACGTNKRNSQATASIIIASPPMVYSSEEATPEPTENASEPTVQKEDTVRHIQITIENKIFSATLEENEAAYSLMQLLQNAPIVLQMSDYSGFEKVAALENSLPESNQHITTRSGDIVLYNGNQIVIFYGSNSWSYTKLGQIDDLTGWEEALGNGDVTLTFSI